jgi:hypothetical protein
MNWTNKKPIKPGIYLLSSPQKTKIQMVFIGKESSDLFIKHNAKELSLVRLNELNRRYLWYGPVKRLDNPSKKWKALREPRSHIPATQCRELGIRVGDVIRHRDTDVETEDNWVETWLTLLWLGRKVSVWQTKKRSKQNGLWEAQGETIDWPLGQGWFKYVGLKISGNKKPAIPR